MSVIREKHLIFVSDEENSNKFYHLSLDQNGVLTKRWGRIGSKGQTKIERTGAHGFEKILREKLRDGYGGVDIVAADAVAVPQSNDHAELTAAARAGLITKPAGRGSVAARAALDSLIDRLVAANAHDILETSGGFIKVDTAGIIQTPLGIVSTRSLHEARGLLEQMRGLPVGPDLTRYIERYLTLVPQKVSSRRGWGATFFSTENTVDTQLDLIDKLTGAVSFAATAREAAIAAASTPGDASKYENLFKLKVSVLADKAVFARLEQMYESSKNRQHPEYRFKLKRVYVLKDTAEATAAYEKRATECGNRKMYYHGTRPSNLLSILRHGFIVPPMGGGKIKTAGRMFGDGTYFSECSTKSMQYAGESGLRSTSGSTRWMVLSEIAAGSEYRPGVGRGSYNDREAHYGKNARGKQWDSINVRPGSGGVFNHEAVIFRDNQISPRYLLEFGV